MTHRARLDRERARSSIVDGKPAGQADRGRGLLPRAAAHLARRQAGAGRPQESAARRLTVFIGHFAVAFAAKRAAPSVSLRHAGSSPASGSTSSGRCSSSLGWRASTISPGITAFTPLDFVYYPWSAQPVHVRGLGTRHSACCTCRIEDRDTRGAHRRQPWCCRTGSSMLVAHRPDLPLAPGSETRSGLGLWNSVRRRSVVEVTMFVAGPVSSTLPAARRALRIGKYGRWRIVGAAAISGVAYVGAAFGPPPPSVEADRLGRAASAAC